MPWPLLMVPIMSTLVGGLLAIRFRQHISVLTGLGAGLLLGAAFLDLLPEALDLGNRAGWNAVKVLGLTLLSYLCFHLLEKGIRTLSRRDPATGEPHTMYRRIGAGMLIFHSFRDGMAIGAAFSASHAAGYAVALGIAAHDLGDGMNTVILTTRGERARRVDYLFLLADALAPVLGGLLTFWWALSLRDSVVVLVLAAGFFLELATGDLLPNLRRSPGTRPRVIGAAFAGALFIFLANLSLTHFER